MFCLIVSGFEYLVGLFLFVVFVLFELVLCFGIVRFGFFRGLELDGLRGEFDCDCLVLRVVFGGFELGM